MNCQSSIALCAKTLTSCWVSRKNTCTFATTATGLCWRMYLTTYYTFNSTWNDLHACLLSESNATAMRRKTSLSDHTSFNVTVVTWKVIPSFTTSYQPVLPHKPPSISTLTNIWWNETTQTIHFLVLYIPWEGEGRKMKYSFKTRNVVFPEDLRSQIAMESGEPRQTIFITAAICGSAKGKLCFCEWDTNLMQ